MISHNCISVDNKVHYWCYKINPGKIFEDPEFKLLQNNKVVIYIIIVLLE